MPKNSSESALSKKIITAINQLPDTWCYKRTAGIGNNAGMPDISGVCAIDGHGVRIELETKLPDRIPVKSNKIGLLEALDSQEPDQIYDQLAGKPTKQILNILSGLQEAGLEIATDRQVHYINKFKDLGAISGVVFSVNHALAVIYKASHE